MTWAQVSRTSLDMTREIRKVLETLPQLMAVKIERDWHQAQSRPDREEFLVRLADLRDMVESYGQWLPKGLNRLVTWKFYHQQSPIKNERLISQLKEFTASLNVNQQFFSAAGIDLRASRSEIFEAAMSLSLLGETIMKKIEGADAEPNCGCVAYKLRLQWPTPGLQPTTSFKEINSFTDLLEHLGFDTNMSERQLRERITRPSFWKKKITQLLREHRARAWLWISPTSIQWTSQDGMSERREIIKCQTQWAELMELVDSEGKTIAAPTPKIIAERQHAEFLARSTAAGLNANDDRAFLFTQTLPSEFHPTRSVPMKFGGTKKITNSVYNKELGPSEGHKWLNRQWGKLRRKIWKINDRRQKDGLEKIALDFVLVAQPHQDQTPHWHTMIFGGEHIEQICDLFIKFFFLPQNDQVQIASIENSSLTWTDRWELFRNQYKDKNRLDIKEMCGTKGGRQAAVAYMARSIGFLSGHLDYEEHGEVNEAMATKQWASEYKIRRFRTSMTGVTAWRMIRKMKEMKGLDVKVAADSGDYGAYFKLFKSGAGEVLKTRGLNLSGEQTTRPAGISYLGNTYQYQPKFKIRRINLDTKIQKPPPKEASIWREVQMESTGGTVIFNHQESVDSLSELPAFGTVNPLEMLKIDSQACLVHVNPSTKLQK